MPDRRFHPLDAKLYSWQIFAGIDHINACGITHFDLKPSNMIVDDRFGLLKIADFGNAKIVKRHDKMDSYQVTRYYRAPELAFGTSEFTTAIGEFFPFIHIHIGIYIG
jgi:glycogen synthase kinase 3 beta